MRTISVTCCFTLDNYTDQEVGPLFCSFFLVIKTLFHVVSASIIADGHVQYFTVLRVCCKGCDRSLTIFINPSISWVTYVHASTLQFPLKVAV